MARLKIPSISSGRKQAMIVRSDLGMRTGKIVAACCYAVTACDKRAFYKATRERLEELEQRARRTEGCIVIRHLAPTTKLDEATTILSLTGMEPIINELTRGMRLL